MTELEKIQSNVLKARRARLILRIDQLRDELHASVQELRKIDAEALREING